MATIFENKSIRPVRIFTEGSILDGLLALGMMARTLDELNAPGRLFLAIEKASLVDGPIQIEPAPLAVNKEAILFAIELRDMGHDPSRPPGGAPPRNFHKAVVRLQVQAHTMEGYVHTIEGGDALGRLNNAARPFIALTAVTLSGPLGQFGIPFVAVNRRHVIAAQETYRVQAVLDADAEAPVPSTR